jgi:uncharacterized membrane protein required for colicin V production
MEIILEFFNQFNWVDIFVFVILARTVYISLKNGLATEFFKALGVVSAVYLSLHYYTPIAKFICERIGNKNPPLEVIKFITFLSLTSIGYSIFFLLRLLMCRFVKAEINPVLNKWTGLVVGVARFFMLASLTLFALFLTPGTYFKKSILTSYSGKYLVIVAPATYSWFWKSIMSKFMTAEKFNKSVRELN